MKQMKLGLLAIAALASVQTIKAQTVDDIVNKYVNALGGKEKVASIKTLRMEGTMNTNGTDVNIVITKSNMIGQRVDISAMGMDGYQIYTPTMGWSYMPFTGQTAPQAMTDEQIKGGAAGLDVQGNLFNYKEKGTQLQLLGNEKVDSSDCYKIIATLKSGKVITYYIDTKTNYVIKSASTQNVNGQDMEVATSYSNYKATANGYIMPFTTVNARGQIDFLKLK